MSQNERAEYLAETYADAILRLSYTYLKNTHDAQDICQTVFVKLLTDPREFDTADHERAYILRMAANACKDLLKSPWRKRTCGLEACAQIPAPEATDGSLLEAAEIGHILGVPTVTVHTRLARGRAKLKDLLGGDDYERSV